MKAVKTSQNLGVTSCWAIRTAIRTATSCTSQMNDRGMIKETDTNSTFIALNLYLMIDSKTQKAKIRDRNR